MAGRQKILGTVNNGYAFLWRVPIVAILAVTPLIVYLSIRPVPEAFRSFWIQDFNFDFFSFNKTRWFRFWSVLLLISFSFSLYKHIDMYSDFVRRTKYYWLLSIVFVVSILLSAVFSPAPFIAWGGMFDRYEGGWVWLSYCLLFAACAFLLRQDVDFRYIIASIIFSSTLIALIGVFQFFGVDFFRSDFGHFIILPQKFITINLGFIFGKGEIYSTFFNTNYGGSIAAIALPPAICMCLFVPSFKKGGALILGYTLLIFFLAVGCRSRAGAVGLLIALIFLIIYLARHYHDKFKRLILIFASFVLIFIGMNRYAGREISTLFTSLCLVCGEWLSLSKSLLIFVYDIGKSQTGIVGLFIAFTLLIGWLKRRYLIKLKQLVMVVVLLISMFLWMDLYAEGPIREGITDIVLEDRPPADSAVRMVDPSLSEEQIRLLLMQEQNKSFFEQKIIEFGLVASGRGYIYLRTLEQRLQSHFLIGTGPDTFAIFFPRDDAYRVFGGYPNTMLIDKVHSMYLQIWYNTGFISFAVFMLLLCLHVIKSMRLFWNIRIQTTCEVLGLGFFLGWTGFLGAALFNDSAISTSPYFWAVFGASIAANHTIQYPLPLTVALPAPARKQTQKINQKARFIQK